MMHIEMHVSLVCFLRFVMFIREKHLYCIDFDLSDHCVDVLFFKKMIYFLMFCITLAKPEKNICIVLILLKNLSFIHFSRLKYRKNHLNRINLAENRTEPNRWRHEPNRTETEVDSKSCEPNRAHLC
jgi:hypothetical protein